MNWHYVVIIIAVAIMFVSMGNNPFEPAPGWVPPDEFKDGIRARITQPEGIGGSGPLSFGGNNSASNFNNFNNQAGFGIPSPANPPTGYGIGGSSATNNYQPSGNFGGTTSGVNNNIPSPGTIPVRPNQHQQKPNTTLPTPFQRLPNVDAPGSSSSLHSFPGIRNVRTSQGAPIKFSGTSVYTKNASGTTIVMPDGTYYLSDGRSIIVQSGKNILPYNANQIRKVN